MGRYCSFISMLLLISVFCFADPCPDGAYIMKQLQAKSDKTKKEQLSQWLPYLDSLKNCNQLPDSITARVFRKIAGLYRQR